MGEKRAYKPRKPGGGRKKLKPEYDAAENLKEQMDAAVALYEEECSLQDIADVTPFTDILSDLYQLAAVSDYIRDMRINEKLGTLLTLLMEQS